MKEGVGADFIITPRCVSPLMGSWSASGTVFPPQPASAMLDYQPRTHRRTFAREDRRIRPERHNPHSIATLRIIIARYLAAQLPYCPCCGSRGG